MEAAQGPGVTLEKYFPCYHLLHVPNREVAITILALSSPQGSCGVMMTMMTMKMKFKITKTLSTPTCAEH